MIGLQPRRLLPCLIFAAAVFAAGSPSAQVIPTIPQDQPGANNDPNSNVQTRRVLPGRIGGDRNENRDDRRQQSRRQPAAPPAPTAEEVLAQAQTLAQTAAASCQVTEAKLLGSNAEGQNYYEVACATGPGYILAGGAPPHVSDCVLIAGQAQMTRERDPAADVGMQCTLPANTDVLRVITAYAQEAGIGCTVEQGMAVGRTNAGNVIYEIGCTGTQGYWIEKTATGWQNTECLEVVTQNAACRFTTAEDSAAGMKAMLAGSEAADCDVTQARFMGENANGRFYEAKCAAGNGVIARIQQTAVQQIYPCETAQRIGGGCTLTQVAAAPAAAPATNEQN